jgi:alkane 1-monooxygenase
MHRRARWARALAELLMTSVSYPHFCIEHVLGHHRHVATPRDPASARLGETVFAFYARCVVGSLCSAWSLERERLSRAGQRAGTLRDRRLRYGLLLAGAYGLAGWSAGGLGLLVFAAQSVVGFSLLEVINYLEHYGLGRRELVPGHYERVRPEHSWNASQRLSNHYLFNLARHADHHANASRPYERLRHQDDAPQLPAGYATMLLLALVPPLWFRVMNPRVADWHARGR